MIVTRFVGKAELEKYLAGETLRSSKIHCRQGRGSASVGFCFSPRSPKEAWRQLKGVVDCDACLELDIDPSLLKVSIGKYRDHDGGCSALLREYCCREYSKGTARLVRLLKPEDFATPEELAAARLVKKMIYDAHKA